MGGWLGGELGGWLGQVGSQVEKGNKPPSTLYMKLWNRENNARHSPRAR